MLLWVPIAIYSLVLHDLKFYACKDAAEPFFGDCEHLFKSILALREKCTVGVEPFVPTAIPERKRRPAVLVVQRRDALSLVPLKIRAQCAICKHPPRRTVVFHRPRQYLKALIHHVMTAAIVSEVVDAGRISHCVSVSTTE